MIKMVAGARRATCMLASIVPKMRLNNGQQYPVVGLGTWKAEGKAVIQAVKDALDIGYRHIDCAHIYLNEYEIGKAISCKIKDGTVKREDLHITSKLWNTFHRPDLVEPAIKTSLKNLKLDYLDMYLIQWPLALEEDNGLYPVDQYGCPAFSDVDYVDTWKAMEELVKKRLTKSIGLANFNKEQVERVLKVAQILPVVCQVEVHPYFNQKKFIEFCKSKYIAVMGCSALGSGDRPTIQSSDPVMLNDARLKQLAVKYHRTPAQIALKYGVQRDIIVIAKSVTKTRLKENLEIWDFEISPADMSAIDKINKNRRYLLIPEYIHHDHYPFNRTKTNLLQV